MKIAKRLTAVMMVVITIISCFTFSASAKNVCNEIGGKTDYNGAVSTTFYVQTKNKKEHYVKMDMTKGKFKSDDYCLLVTQYKNIYDYYEILVFGKKADGSYTQISKNNVKNKGSYKIKFSGYTDYKIKVYSWKTATINQNGKFWVHPITKKATTNAEWVSGHIPTWRIQKTSGVTLCR